jgi:DNA-binding NarL/FixJ family response regulator
MSTVVALVDDLMFLSRIREAARGHGLEVRPARTAADAVAAAQSGGRMVFLDLDSPRLPVAATLAALRGDASLAGLPVVGFFSHVEAQRGRDAAESGCTIVLPRSAFVQRLDGLLADAARGSGRVGEPGSGA